jgi:hypothetical protein
MSFFRFFCWIPAVAGMTVGETVKLMAGALHQRAC